MFYNIQYVISGHNVLLIVTTFSYLQFYIYFLVNKLKST